MSGYLVDSNHLSASLHKVSACREQIQAGCRAGHRFVSCYPVLCEVEVAIQQSQRADDNHRRLTQLLRHVRLWPLNYQIVKAYGNVYIELRRLGRVLSQVDMMLAAYGRHYQMTVLTTDGDFEALADLRVENWVGPTR
jgi:predicted nucleic acid-binding protein